VREEEFSRSRDKGREYEGNNMSTLFFVYISDIFGVLSSSNNTALTIGSPLR
jgi:hypothetical protein